MSESPSQDSGAPHGTERMISIKGRISCPTCGGVGTVLTWTTPNSMENDSMARGTWLFWTALLSVCGGVFLIGLAGGVWWLGGAISIATTMPYAPLLEGMIVGFVLLVFGVIILVEGHQRKVSRE